MGGERSGDGSARIQKQSVSLWDVLTLLAFSGSLGGTIGAVRTGHISGLRFALLAGWGVLLAIGSVVCARAGGGRLLERVSSGRLLPLVSLAAAAWICASSLLSFVLTSGLIRLLP